MGPNQIKAFLIQTSPTFITGVNCKVAPLSFQQNKKFCSCLIQARSKVTSHCLCRFEAFLPQLNASCWLSASNPCHQGWSFSCSWQRRDRRREETAGLAAASLAAWHHPTSARTAGSHRFLFLKPRRPSAPQGSWLQFLAPRVVSFLLFYLQAGPTQTQGKSRAEQSPTLTRCPQLPGLQMCFSFLVWDPLPTRGYKGMEEAQQAISSQQKIFPHVAFLQCFEGRFSLESSMCQQHGLPCTSLHGKSLPYKGTSPDWRSLLLCFLCSPPALLVWLALNEKSYESNNVNFTLSHQKLYPSYFLEK